MKTDSVAPADRAALLVQPNIPSRRSGPRTISRARSPISRNLSLSQAQQQGQHFDPIVWPESPSPFFSNDVRFRDPVSELARLTGSWIVAGEIGVASPAETRSQRSLIYNSAALVSPRGDWTSRYDKMHLVPFGEYLPFPQVFGFAGGLTKEVGEFQHGSTRRILEADGARLGTFICYESIFPDEVRKFARDGAQVLVNISNDGWYGDSGAWKQHIQQTRMRAIENDRWLLSATNTGLTAAIDPLGRIVAEAPRKERTVLVAPYRLQTEYHLLHAAWGLVCAALCHNFCSRAGNEIRVSHRPAITREERLFRAV